MWHEKWPLDTILDALKEAYDSQRFDLGHEKWYKWIRDNKPHLEVDYLRLEEFRDVYTHKLSSKSLRPSTTKTSSRSCRGCSQPPVTTIGMRAPT